MTDQDEKLSYLLDDHPAAGADSAVDAAIADVNLQYRMRRYRMIGEVMRHELPPAVNTGFHHEVMAKIRAEDAISAAKPSADQPEESPGWLNWAGLKPFAGLAVAASVAMVTVALWQPVPQTGGQVDGGVASVDQAKIVEIAQSIDQQNAVPVTLNGMRWKVEKDAPELQQKLNAYLVNHTEYSNSMQGLIPQARVAGFDAEQ